MAAGDVEKFTADKLDCGNWLTWKYQVTRVLKAKDLFKYVDGSETLPEEPTAEQTKTFESKCNKALALITMAISTPQLYLITSYDDPVNVWKALKDHFEGDAVGRKLLLTKTYFRCEMRESTSVESHLKYMKELTDKLATLGAPVTEEYQVATLLGSLPKTYATLVTALESQGDRGLSLTFVQRALLNEEEKQNRIHKSDESAENDEVAMISKKKLRCYNYKQFGHVRSECPQLQIGTYETKHSAKMVEAEGIESDDSVEYTFTIGTGQTLGGEDQWFVDSGASCHMVNQQEVFYDYFEFNVPKTIKLGDGRQVAAMGTGKVRLEMLHKRRKSLTVTLNNALYVPGLTCNLFSVRSANLSGGGVTFIGNKCVIYNKKGKACGFGSVTGKLYKLHCRPVVCNEAHIVNGSSKFDLWHQRMGHLNCQQMEEAIGKDLVTGVKLSKKGKLSFCTGCAEGKLYRKPFKPVGEIKSTKSLELVHSDVCGPMQTESLSGKIYFVSFIDDFSRWCCIYFMRNKSEVFEKFQKYEIMVSNITGNKIGTLRSDRGGEYTSEEFENYLESKGIHHELSVAHSPQQNGVAERANRTLVECARTLLCHAGLPKSFWAEALVTSAYVRNRVPTSSVVGSKTPHEKWHGIKPNLKHLRVFGCIAFALSFDGSSKKLDKKSRKYRFIGYCLKSKGYRLFDDKSKKIVVRRDVVFDESRFEWNISGSSSPQMSVDVIFKDHATFEIEFDEECDPVGDDQQVASRPKRIVKPPVRYGYDEYADMIYETDHIACLAKEAYGLKTPRQVVGTEKRVKSKKNASLDTCDAESLRKRKILRCRSMYKADHQANDACLDNVVTGLHSYCHEGSLEYTRYKLDTSVYGLAKCARSWDIELNLSKIQNIINIVKQGQG